MEFNDYIKARNEVIDNDYRYNVYRHVVNRLVERFGFNHRIMNLDLWQRVSYACARRELPVLFRDDVAVLFADTFMGNNLIWVYSRRLRCLVTVYPRDDNAFKLHFREEMRKMGFS